MLNRKYIGTLKQHKQIIQVEDNGQIRGMPLYLKESSIPTMEDFGWGFVGIKSKQAAFSICYDALIADHDKLLPTILDHHYPEFDQARAVYRDFCSDVLAKIPLDEEFAITHKEVIEFITFTMLRK